MATNNALTLPTISAAGFNGLFGGVLEIAPASAAGSDIETVFCTR
ncbi:MULTISPECIES: hypothetical protein [Bradyrhizobium]|jgi:hypothetical protein|nr:MULTISPECIES: hypothetical protein [Bradyrhizobium]EIG62253.1 hypothetical protein Bra1253DRAFT_07152 [Bradyrhizobium sp. WSM1253]